MSLQKKQSMDKEMFRTIISENQEYTPVRDKK